MARWPSLRGRRVSARDGGSARAGGGCAPQRHCERVLRHHRLARAGVGGHEHALAALQALGGGGLEGVQREGVLLGRPAWHLLGRRMVGCDGSLVPGVRIDVHVGAGAASGGGGRSRRLLQGGAGGLRRVVDRLAHARSLARAGAGVAVARAGRALRRSLLHC